MGATPLVLHPDLSDSVDMPFRTAETYLSWLVMVGDLVLKTKKPVWTEFLDLTSRTARLAVAEREVRLNRRLAPDVYLGVARLSGAANLDEPVVVMRRMPDERRLASLAGQGHDLRTEIADLARVLADFHRAVATTPSVATTSAALRRWRENTDQLLTHGSTVLPREQLLRVQAMAERYLAGREPLFAQRRRAARFRDGHGDLLADDIFCLPDGPRVLDCLEFDDDMRAGDVLSDVAFLAMDLEHLGRPELGSLLLREHRNRLGDDWPASLADHWIAYRAQVRAKIACLRATQGFQDAFGQARDLMELAERRLLAARVRIVLVGGTPGTGKSTLAAALARRTGWPVVRSDVLRRAVAPDLATAEATRAARYGPAVSGQVLQGMLTQARDLVEAGRTVVLDATWADEQWRQQVRDLALGTHCDLICLQTVLPDQVADERLRRRATEGRDASDATPEVAALVRSRFAPWPEALPVDSRQRPRQLADQVVRLLGAAD